MKNYCLYTLTGKIIQYGTCPAKDLALQVMVPDRLKALPNTFLEPSEQHYIDENAAHVVCDDYDLSTLPIPCLITIEGVEYSITEPPVFSFDAPGIYDLYVVPGNARYKDKVISFEYSA
jgi:hypothetical protein